MLGLPHLSSILHDSGLQVRKYISAQQADCRTISRTSPDVGERQEGPGGHRQQAQEKLGLIRASGALCRCSIGHGGPSFRLGLTPGRSDLGAQKSRKWAFHQACDRCCLEASEPKDRVCLGVFYLMLVDGGRADAHSLLSRMLKTLSLSPETVFRLRGVVYLDLRCAGFEQPRTLEAD